MKKFGEYINETGRKASPKMLTISNLVKLLDNDKNWETYKSGILDFFERGSYSKDYGVSYDVMAMMFKDDSSWEEEYQYDLKKAVWTNVDKRLRASLKKLNKEYIISKSECYKEMKIALENGGDIFDDIVYAILDSKKNSGVKITYPKFNNYRDVESWMDSYNVTKSLKNNCSKDNICLLMTEGIQSISITKEDADEYISIGGRTSTWTVGHKIDIITYTTNKVLSFEVSKSETNRV